MNEFKFIAIESLGIQIKRFLSLESLLNHMKVQGFKVKFSLIYISLLYLLCY